MIDYMRLIEHMPMFLVVMAVVGLLIVVVLLVSIVGSFIYTMLKNGTKKKEVKSADFDDDDDDFMAFDDDDEFEKLNERKKLDVDVSHPQNVLYNDIINLFPDMNFDVEQIATYKNYSDSEIGITVSIAVLGDNTIYLNLHIENKGYKIFNYERNVATAHYVQLDHENHKAAVLPEYGYYDEGGSKTDTIKLAVFLYEVGLFTDMIPDFKI